MIPQGGGICRVLELSKLGRGVSAVRSSKRFIVTMLSVLLVLALGAGCGSKPASEPGQTQPEAKKLKVALLLPGVVSDAGWNAGAYQALNKLKDELGIETSYVENVNLSNVEGALTDYASKGYDVIVCHSFNFGDAIMKVAPNYPKTVFFWSQGFKNLPNVATYSAPLQETAYLCGMLGAYMSKTGKLGYIAGMDTPPMISALEGYRAGAKAANPDVQVIYTFPGVWSDVEKGKQTALAQIQSGVDFMMGRGDGLSLGVLQACQEKQVWCIGDVVDQNALAPKLMVTSTMWDLSADIKALIKDLQEGKEVGKEYKLGMKDGACDIAPFHDLVPKDIADKVEAARQKIKSGELVVPEVTQLSK